MSRACWGGKISVMKNVKNLGLIVVSVFISFLTSLTFLPVKLYEYFFPPVGENIFLGYQALAELIGGFIIAYALFLPLLFMSFNSVRKYWWMGVLLLPVVYFAYMDSSRFWFYLLVVLIGWGIGLLLNKKVIPYFKRVNY